MDTFRYQFASAHNSGIYSSHSSFTNGALYLELLAWLDRPAKPDMPAELEKLAEFTARVVFERPATVGPT